MLYSIYDYESLCSLDYDTAPQPQMAIKSGRLYLARDGEGKLTVAGLFSTDPSDYLKPEYAPGAKYQ